MFFRAVVAGLLGCSIAVAKAPPVAPVTQPTTTPATQPVAKKYPNVAELVAQRKAEQAAIAAKAQVAMFEFDSEIVERPADFSWFGPGEAPTLRSIVTRIHKAGDDEDLKAVLINFRVGASMGFAQAMEIRDALDEVRKAGKSVFVYADSYDTTLYLVASAATDVCMLEGGEVSMPGVGLETMFYRGTMDKVGITPDFIQIGEFKGAEEPYTRTQPSDELRGELNRLVESLYALIVDNVAGTRGLSRDTVRNAIDQTMLPGEMAKERGFVDHLIDQDGLRPLMEEKLGNAVNLIDDYGAAERQEIDFTNIFSVFKAMTRKPDETDGPAVALIYAQGTIVDGKGEAGLLDAGGVGSESMRDAFRKAAQDDNVKAVVIRIDSPGGSALASEVMWQAARRVAKTKPVVVSIGSMAASGGYYLASAGDYIFADPAAIVGSIGVVGGKFVLKDLYEKIGLYTEEFSKGRNAGLFSSSKLWDEKQRELVKKSMVQTYEQFTRRVMTTREGKIKDIDKVARGRIFLAADAQKLGMVDELGGLERAIAYAAGKASLETGKFDVITLPGPRTLADLLEGSRTELSTRIRPNIQLSPDSLLLALPPSVRAQVAQQLQLLRLLERRSVILMAPFTVRIR